ncbi:MAG: hypothetical protein QHC67_14830 [Sphingobium sp.]|uniref:hypothetical protein n=1 Tax=Sphingobium sp. TaxID=1912891 RepID=UPI0029A54368|nr:hypothetical protein [Sphingobium sp.]MDX3911075.1 hypothetical protein [Sphingobium sp.]
MTGKHSGEATAHGPQKTVIERIARHLATRAFDPSPPKSDDWSAQIEAAASLLAIIKDPDDAMAQAGDAMVWRKMIDAALVDRWKVEHALGGERAEPPGGSDEEGDVLLEHGSTGIEKTPSWVQLSKPPKP